MDQGLQGLKKVRDYAKECGCTPQNIYGHLRTYAAELEGHVFQGKGRQGQLLDDYAQEFLRSVMYPKEISTDSTITKLQEEVAELRTALFQAMQKDMELASKLAATEGERDRLKYDVKQFQKQLLLAEETDADKTAKLEAAEKEAAENARRIQEEEEKAQDLQRQLDEERAARSEAEAQNAALKGRGLWARITRKGE